MDGADCAFILYGFYMKYKVKFQQTVAGVENCECIIDANSEEEARLKLYNRQFTTYIITKQNFERDLIEEEELEFRIVSE